MLGLWPTATSRYYNCCTDGSISPANWKPNSVNPVYILFSSSIYSDGYERHWKLIPIVYVVRLMEVI
jgi:hypothetical protein